MNLQLENKTALVTGSTKGIGFAIARWLAQEGANVVVNGRSEASTIAAAKKIGRKTRGVAADVSTRWLRDALQTDSQRGHSRKQCRDF